MTTLNAMTILVAVLFAGLGLAVGFARTLRFFTKGIFAFFDTLPDASEKERLLITVRHNAPGLFKLRCYF